MSSSSVGGSDMHVRRINESVTGKTRGVVMPAFIAASLEQGVTKDRDWYSRPVLLQVVTASTKGDISVGAAVSLE